MSNVNLMENRGSISLVVRASGYTPKVRVQLRVDNFFFCIIINIVVFIVLYVSFEIVEWIVRGTPVLVQQFNCLKRRSW